MDKKERDRLVRRQKRQTLARGEIYKTSLTDGLTATLLLPVNMTPKDFELLHKYIDLLADADRDESGNDFDSEITID